MQKDLTQNDLGNRFKISVNETSEVARRLEIEIPRELFDSQYDRELSKIVGRVSIKGFRPGKAPKEMVQKMYGSSIRGEVISDLINNAYQRAVSENSLKVVGQPNIKLDGLIEETTKTTPIMVTADVEIFPEPELKNYFGVACDAEVEEFSEARLEKSIQQFLRMFAKEEPVTDRKVSQKDDVVEVTISSTIDGADAPMYSMKPKGTLELDEERYIPEVIKGLIGLEVGGKRTVTSTVPEEANAEVAGKTITHELELHAISTRIVPELNDEFVKENKFGETVQDLRERFTKELTTEVEQRNRFAKERAVLDAVSEKNKFMIPQAMIDEEIRQMLFEMRALNPRDEKSFQVPMDDFRKEFGEGAEKRLRRALVIRRIADQEDVKFTDEDLENWIKAEAEKSEISIEEAKKQVQFDKSREQMKRDLRLQNVLDSLIEKANIKETIKAEEDDEPKAKSKKKAAKKKAE